MSFVPRLLYSFSQKPLQNSSRSEVQLITQLLDSGEVGDLQENLLKVSTSIINHRLCCLQWIVARPNRRWMTAILRLARMLFRNSDAVEEFNKISKYSEFVQFGNYVISCLDNEDDFAISAKFMLNLASRLASHSSEPFATFRLQRMALRCLHSHDMLVVQAALELLAILCDESASCRKDLCETAAIDACLHLLPEGDILTQKLCASLLRILCGEEQAQQQLRIYDGVPILIGCLSIRNSRLKWHVAWCLAQLADDVETANEIAQVGGIALLMVDMSSKPPENGINDWVAMLAAECAVLAQLCVVDALQSVLVHSNALFLLGRLLFLSSSFPEIAQAPALPTLQCSSFRVLRLIFSSERHRPIFKRVFPTNILEAFVDVGNYVQDLTSYASLLVLYQHYLDSTQLTDIEALWENINQRRKPIGHVGDYDLLEQLGAGAFGCVYTARKSTTASNGPPKLFAVKEIFMVHPRGSEEKEKSFGDVISEVKIIKQQLRHPNVVRYRRIFEENGRLYVVMDLVEGSPLRDLILSAKERNSPFGEDRIWCFLIQLLLGLRYLHKEKSIIHRDLKPTNIMVTSADQIVITDFGLARQKGPEYLKSAVGTIIYSCPEVVQNEPYGEKADIWSLGCVIYEIIVLQPAFQSNNMLKLAKMICEAEYDPLPKGYSQKLINVVDSCLKINSKERPDIIELCISPSVAPSILEFLDDATRRIHAEAKKRESNTSMFAVLTPTPTMNTPRERVREVIKKVAGPESIDKPRYRKDIKALSAGQQPARSSSTFSLPKISGAGTPTSMSSSAPRVRSSEGLTLRSTVLRPVSDPVLTILEQVRRLFAVTSSARGESVNHRRRLVEQFRKKVFSKDVSNEQMKTHFRKLAVEDQSEIELDLGFADFRVILAEMGHPELSVIMSLIPTHRGFNRAFDEMMRAPFGGAPYWMNPSDCLNVGTTSSEVVNTKDHFGVTMDVSQYKPEEIKVHIEGRILAIEGHHELKDNHSHLTRSFTRKWTLPEDVDLDAVKTSLTRDGHLVIDAKKKDALAPARRELAIEHQK